MYPFMFLQIMLLTERFLTNATAMCMFPTMHVFIQHSLVRKKQS